MQQDQQPVVVRIALPTPDLIAVRHDNGLVTVFADTSLPDALVDELLDDLDSTPGTGHALD